MLSIKKVSLCGKVLIKMETLNGIILINKEKDITSRDVVNKVSKKLNTKKVGHAGTLDPLATGLLVIGVGSSTKILELLTLDTKEYVATVKIIAHIEHSKTRFLILLDCFLFLFAILSSYF